MIRVVVLVAVAGGRLWRCLPGRGGLGEVLDLVVAELACAELAAAAVGVSTRAETLHTATSSGQRVIRSRQMTAEIAAAHVHVTMTLRAAAADVLAQNGPRVAHATVSASGTYGHCQQAFLAQKYSHARYRWHAP
jgi:hypothetical protein